MNSEEIADFKRRAEGKGTRREMVREILCYFIPEDIVDKAIPTRTKRVQHNEVYTKPLNFEMLNEHLKNISSDELEEAIMRVTGPS